MKRCWLVLMGLVVVAAHAAADEPKQRPAMQVAVLQTLEQRLLEASTVKMHCEVFAVGAFSANLEGSLELRSNNQATLRFDGTFGDQPVELQLDSDGKRMRGGSNEALFRMEAPATLHEALVIGFTRMGILHNLARLVSGDPPDHAGGGVREWVNVDVRDTEGRIDFKGRSLQTVTFSIDVAGQPSGVAMLWLAADTGLLVQRAQRVEFGPDQVMWVVERYTEVSADAERRSEK